jgi:hypothetical protein
MIVREEAKDSCYYGERAHEERARAALCHDQTAALVHLRLAAEYEKRARRVLVEG